MLLPSPIHLSGVVTDGSGKPIAGVRIDHSGSSSKSDSAGRFDVRTRAPAVVFRATGFQSRYYRLADDTTLTVTLGGPTPLMKQCGLCVSCLPLKQFVSVLCLPRVHGVHAGEQGNDIDYGQRWLWIKTSSGKKVGIQHGAGPMWGTGLPFDVDVWLARKYTEIDYRDAKGLPIVDARGQNADGRCWRVLGRFGETASYRDVPAGDTALLDQVVDGASVRPAQAK